MSASFVVGVLLFVSACPVQGQLSARFEILLLAEKGQKNPQILHDVLRAHLANYDVDVRFAPPLSQPATLSQQVDSAGARLRAGGATAAVWVDGVGRRIHILALEASGGQTSGEEVPNEHLVVRDLPVDSRDWRADCEAISAIVRAALSPWLVRREDPEQARSRSSFVIQALDTERISLTSSAMCPSPKPPEPYLFVSVYPAFEGSFVSQNRAPGLGGSTTLGVSYKERLGLRASAGFSAQSDEDEYVRLERFPVRVGLEGTLYWRMLGFGLDLDAIFDFARWIGPHPVRVDQDVEWTPGFGAALHLRVRIFPGVHFQAEGGLDLYDRRMRYLVSSESVFEYMPIQPRFRIGVIFGLPVAYKE